MKPEDFDITTMFASRQQPKPTALYSDRGWYEYGRLGKYEVVLVAEQMRVVKVRASSEVQAAEIAEARTRKHNKNFERRGYHIGDIHIITTKQIAGGLNERFRR